MTELLKLTWENIDDVCNKVSDLITKVNYKPEIIISIGRGGLIPSRILSDRLNVSNIYMYNVKLYTGINARKSKPTIEFFNCDVQNKSVLLVDDILDSGITVNAVLEDLLKKRPKAVRTATLYCREDSISKPTFYGSIVRKGLWIEFPWEKVETEKENK